MCDCYYHKCEYCNQAIPWHIGNFAFERNEFKVWCQDHIQFAPIGATVFTLTLPYGFDYNIPISYCLPKGYRFAVIGPEIEPNGDNYPNMKSGFYMIENTKDMGD